MVLSYNRRWVLRKTYQYHPCSWRRGTELRSRVLFVHQYYTRWTLDMLLSSLLDVAIQYVSVPFLDVHLTHGQGHTFLINHPQNWTGDSKLHLSWLNYSLNQVMLLAAFRPHIRVAQVLLWVRALDRAQTISYQVYFLKNPKTQTEPTSFGNGFQLPWLWSQQVEGYHFRAGPKDFSTQFLLLLLEVVSEEKGAN